MGIDLSGKFSSKTKKAMKLLGEVLGLGKNTPIEFKDKIDSAVTDDDDKQVAIDIKTVNLSTTDSQLKANIKAMVKTCKPSSLDNINLIHFLGKDGILACLSNSSFTSSSSHFKKIYKSISNESAELLTTDVNNLTADQVEKALTLLTGLRKAIITYLTLKKRNNYTDSTEKFEDGGAIDKCKVVACPTLLLGLNQHEIKLNDRLRKLNPNAIPSSSSSSGTHQNNTASPKPSKAAEKGKPQVAKQNELQNILTTYKPLNNFIDASTQTSVTSLMQFLKSCSKQTQLSKAIGCILVTANPYDQSFNVGCQALGDPDFVKKICDDLQKQFENTERDPKNDIPTICANHKDSLIIFVNNNLFNSIRGETSKPNQYIASATKPLITNTDKSATTSGGHVELRNNAAPQVAEKEDKHLLDDAIKDVISTCKNDNFIDANTQTSVDSLLAFLKSHSKKEFISKAIGFLLVTVKSSKRSFEVGYQAVGDKSFVEETKKYLENRKKTVDVPKDEISAICEANTTCPIIFVNNDLFDSIEKNAKTKADILSYIASADNEEITTRSNAIKKYLAKPNTATFIRPTLNAAITSQLKLPELKAYINKIAAAVESSEQTFPQDTAPPSLSATALKALTDLWESIPKTQSSSRRTDIDIPSFIKKRIPIGTFFSPSQATTEPKKPNNSQPSSATATPQPSNASEKERSSIKIDENDQIQKMEECTSKLWQEYENYYNEYNGTPTNGKDSLVTTCLLMNKTFTDEHLRRLSNTSPAHAFETTKKYTAEVNTMQDSAIEYYTTMKNSLTEAKQLFTDSTNLGFTSENYTTTLSKLGNAIKNYENFTNDFHHFCYYGTGKVKIGKFDTQYVVIPKITKEQFFKEPPHK